MRYIQCFILGLMLLCTFTSCYKDKGNYNYQDVNELRIENFDLVNGYTVHAGDTLKVAPALKGTLDKDATVGQYTYEWSIDFPTQDSIISTEKVLNVKLVFPPGRYTLQYRVKDVKTGLQVQERTALVVSTRVFEGYMVMSEVNGKTRLDMVSYQRNTQSFEVIHDVLAAMGSTLPMQGKPIQVFCTETNWSWNVVSPQSYRIYLLTETGTYKIDPETFGYNELSSIRYEMVGTLPNNFYPSFMGGALFYYEFPVTFLTEGNNIYRRSMEGVVFPYLPVNVYKGETTPFKAWPQVASHDVGAVIYNMDNRSFTTMESNETSVIDLPPGLGFPQGKDMVHMEDNQATGYGYAILKDPGTTDYALLRFYPGYAFADYYGAMNATDIEHASHFAVSPELGYVFYSVGGKLYEYDPFLNKSFLMLDKGNAAITHLSFQDFFNPNYNDTYFDFGKMLTVATLDPSGMEGSNGTLERYTVPPINAPLILKNTWQGFGKIVSTSYRERN